MPGSVDRFDSSDSPKIAQGVPEKLWKLDSKIFQSMILVNPKNSSAPCKALQT